MKQNIYLEGYTIKVLKDGQTTYWQFNTSGGLFNVFDKTMAGELLGVMNKNVSVEIEQKGQYKNLTKFYNVCADVPVEKVEDAVPAKNSRDEMMLTSYAKDVFIELLKCTDKNSSDTAIEMGLLMTHACDLIKQARKEMEK